MSDASELVAPTRREVVDALRRLHWMCTTDEAITVAEIHEAVDRAGDVLDRVGREPRRERARQREDSR